MRSTILLLAVVTLISSSCEKDESIPSQNVTDVDGNAYKTIAIGTQLWMAENLKVIHSSNGDAIDYYISDTAYINTFGQLYNWESALKACPKGWHLPSKDEWFVLLNFLDKSVTNPDSTGFLGEKTGAMLKSNRLWSQQFDGTENSTGFSALPSGYYEDGNLSTVGLYANFWSSTDGNDDQAFGGINILYNSSSVFRGYMNKAVGHCVRCLKDQ